MDNGPFRLVGATIAGCTAGMYGGGLSNKLSSPSVIVGGSFSGCTAISVGTKLSEHMSLRSVKVETVVTLPSGTRMRSIWSPFA